MHVPNVWDNRADTSNTFMEQQDALNAHFEH